MKNTTNEADSPDKGRLLTCLARNRYGGVFLFIGLFLIVSFLTRLALLVVSWKNVDAHPGRLFGVFLCGALFDLVAAATGVLPLHFYLWAAPKRWLDTRMHRWALNTWFFLAIYVLLFVAAAEWFFWDEFSSRFNFIAVDYLVYTTEVIGNIEESYPLPAILGGLAVATILVWLGLRAAPVSGRILKQPGNDGRRWLGGALGLLVPAAGFFLLSNRNVPEFGNSYNQELARNGSYSFFAAYRENELSYERFYSTAPTGDTLERLRPLLKEKQSRFVSTNTTEIARSITATGPERRYNIIQITVESLSAKYLGCFGNRRGLTPNLDRLFEESIVFTNFYATGTRTVRGMEALSLSVPPTPGQSILRRPNNGDLFTLGSVVASRGYDAAFIYSGFGYFDNMNAFFAANGYRIIDRAKVAKNDITYATTWGACDEDLYRWTLREADTAAAKQQPFYHFVMTTSNHRPFTYPEGRIDMPGGKRYGAVKYTDYAIGRFLEEARKRPWFTNTLIVVVADHCASAAGKTALPVDGYHIPAFIWNPSLITPRKVGTLCSQIDLPPTLLGLMNWNYQSRFYGKDIFQMAPEDGRAFISTYQKLGYLTPDRLAILEPMRRRQQLRLDRKTGEWQTDTVDESFILQAVSYYQSASYLFTHRLNSKTLADPAGTRLSEQ